MGLCWKFFYFSWYQTSNHKIILLSLLTFARDVLISTELFSSQWGKREMTLSAEKEMKRIKGNLMRCKQSSSLSWRVDCKLKTVRKRTVCKISLKTVTHQSKQQDIFKAYLSNKLKLCLSEDNKQKYFNHKVQYSCFLRFTSHCFTGSGSTLARYCARYSTLFLRWKV